MYTFDNQPKYTSGKALVKEIKTILPSVPKKDTENFGEYAERIAAMSLFNSDTHTKAHTSIFESADLVDGTEVKSSGFTLQQVTGHEGTFEEQLEDYFTNGKAKRYAYVTKDCKVYLLNKRAFEQILRDMTRIDPLNGWVRMKPENKLMKRWLELNAKNYNGEEF